MAPRMWSISNVYLPVRFAEQIVVFHHVNCEVRIPWGAPAAIDPDTLETKTRRGKNLTAIGIKPAFVPTWHDIISRSTYSNVVLRLCFKPMVASGVSHERIQFVILSNNIPAICHLVAILQVFRWAVQVDPCVIVCEKEQKWNIKLAMGLRLDLFRS